MKRVLIIEDDAEQAATLSRLLRREGVMSETAGTLEEGLASFRAASCACVVLDLGLPDSDSAETAARIPEFTPVPVVALTGNEDRAIVRVVRSHGASYALKGSNTNVILEKILSQIEWAQPSREVEGKIIGLQRAGAPPNFFQRWGPAVTIAVSMLSASGAGGMFLYRSISEQAAQSQRNSAHFDTLDRAIVQIQTNMERMLQVQADLQLKAQTSMEDRAGIHRELGGLMQSQRELKEDVVRRLERIEDKIDRKLIQ